MGSQIKAIIFNECWVTLELLGHVDGIGGAEYRRISDAWETAFAPTSGVGAFILSQIYPDRYPQMVSRVVRGRISRKMGELDVNDRDD